jgi:PAS domain S-box-containing protein
VGAALLNSDEHLQLLVQQVKDYAILILDLEGRITTWNEGAERIKGYRAEEIIGKHFSKFYTPEAVAQERPSQELKIAAAEGRFEEEGWRVRKDGSRFWASVIITALRDETRQLCGFGKVTRDISERKRAEENVERQRSELAQANAKLLFVNTELETFSYSVSHELSAGGLQHLDRILAAVTHMGHLVDDLLDLARIGRKELVRKAVKLDHVLREAMADLPPEANDRKIDWQIEPLPAVECDSGLVKIVFTNLLSNAVKFTRSRQQASIQIGAVTKNGILTFFVRDNGVGFDPKYADKLFGVFQRLHNQQEFEGTGVGLATVQRIVHRHGGTIWAESQPDHGTTFFFTLGSRQTEQHNESTEVKLGKI